MGIVWTNRNPRQNVLKRTVTAELKLGSFSIKVVTILIMAFLSIFYLFQSNASATRTYLVKKLEDQKQDIVAENEELRYEAERLKNLQMTEDEAKRQGMEEFSQVDAVAGE